ncbi:MAG: LytTR family DNA-binding domain-containing protein [Bacteroidota bacterium]
MNCLIVDDEPLAREGLADYAQQIDFLQLVGMAEHPMEALSILEQNKIDLLFLDIQMPKMNGIDFLKSLEKRPLIILTTAYPSFALEGYQLDVLDYLVKPITFQRFLKSALKAKKQFNLLAQADQPVASTTAAPPATDHFFIKSDGKIEKISFAELLYAEGMQNYLILHTERGKFTTLLTLKSLLGKLPPKQFQQVHRSFIVQLSKVQTIEGHMLQIGTSSVPVSRSRLEKITQLLLGDNLIN